MNPGSTIRLARALLGARLTGRRTPLVASLLLTNRCNLDCAYCGRAGDGTNELSAAQWTRLVDELADLGCLRLSVTGGEPLMRPDLGDILARARDRGLSINLNTNGHLVERRLEVVRLVQRVTISLDGPAAVHDAVRGPGSFDAVVHAAEIARRENLPVTFYTVLSRDNLEHLPEVLALARRFGARAFFQPGTALGLDGCTPNPTAPDAGAYRAALDRLIEWKQQSQPVGNSIAALRYLRHWPDPAPIVCLGHLLFCRIETDGNLRICGRDEVGERIDAVSLGLRAAIDKLPAPACTACWSAARVEFHLLARMNPGAIINYLRNS